MEQRGPSGRARKANKTVLENLPPVKDKSTIDDDRLGVSLYDNLRKSHAVGFDLQRDSLFQERATSSTPTSQL